MHTIQQQPFGQLPTEKLNYLYTLTNRAGIVVQFMNYGATLVSCTLPPDHTNITLGFDRLDDYLKHPFYFGCTIGRVANRINNAQFQLKGETIQLEKNDGRHHIHGGRHGFDKVVWTAGLFTADDQSGIIFTYTSQEGEEGYPGQLVVKTIYVLTDRNELIVQYWARSDKPTPINLTNHTYWNLQGAGNGTILDHELQIHSDYYIVTDQDKIPNGEIKSVDGTPFDFRKQHKIGHQMPHNGFDLFYPLPQKKQLKTIAQAKCLKTKYILSVATTQPGLQFFTGSNLYHYPIAENRYTEKFGGFCFETQGFPDAMNNANFPSIILVPEEIYWQKTVYLLR